MKRRFILTICCCITIALSITVSAQASTVDFVFAGIPWGDTSAGSSFSFTEGGLNLTVSATSGSDASWVNWSPFGLGVSSGWWDDPQIDGFFWNDLLLLSFDKDVTISSATFTLTWWGNDEFHLFVDDESLVSAYIPGNGVYPFSAINTLDRTGRNFGFTVTDWNDNYMIAGVTVEVTQTPVPATGLLFVSSMLGILGIRKNRRH